MYRPPYCIVASGCAEIPKSSFILGRWQLRTTDTNASGSVQSTTIGVSPENSKLCAVLYNRLNASQKTKQIAYFYEKYYTDRRSSIGTLFIYLYLSQHNNIHCVRKKSKPNTMYHRNVKSECILCKFCVLDSVKYAQSFIWKYCLIADLSLFKYW